MSEMRRVESGSPAEAAERDSRAEALLVEGLDKYFAGRYEDAIHLWTRVLFLDRSHARARAYIDRARTALGERQRRADEMLHAAEESASRGELDQARSLVSQASRTSGDDERIARVWADIERVERLRTAREPEAVPASVHAEPLRSWRVTASAASRLLAAAAVGALLVTLATSPAVREWVRGGDPLPSPSLSRAAIAPVLSRGDVALLRARTLYARGRLASALAVLDSVPDSVPDRAAVDALRVEIQEILLSTAQTPAEGATARSGSGQP